MFVLILAHQVTGLKCELEKLQMENLGNVKKLEKAHDEHSRMMVCIVPFKLLTEAIIHFCDSTEFIIIIFSDGYFLWYYRKKTF